MTDPIMVHRTQDEPSPGPSCFTVTTDMSSQLCSYIYFVSVLLVLFDLSSTNIDSLQVLSLMAPKQDRVYAYGCSKSVASSARQVIGSDEHDPKYDPPGPTTPSGAARATRAMPKKVASGVVTASQCDDERTLTGTTSGSTTHKQGGWSEEVSVYAEVLAPAIATQSTSSDEADNPNSTPSSLTCSLTPVADQANRCCVDAQYQVYLDAKILNFKGVMTRTLTLEWRIITGSLTTMPEIHNIFTRHQLEWTACSLGRYNEELVCEFYAFYVATI